MSKVYRLDNEYFAAIADAIIGQSEYRMVYLLERLQEGITNQMEACFLNTDEARCLVNWLGTLFEAFGTDDQEMAELGSYFVNPDSDDSDRILAATKIARLIDDLATWVNNG